MPTSSLTLRLEIELIANDCWASGSGVGTGLFACSLEFLLLGFRWGQLNDRLRAHFRLAALGPQAEWRLLASEKR